MQLPIISVCIQDFEPLVDLIWKVLIQNQVKKNPQNPMYTQLGVLTKGTIIEVNVSELGLVTAGGKVVWGRWAQITNSFVPLDASYTR